MPNRRRPSGTSLLRATSGVFVMSAGCVITGNLVSPPMVQLCTTVEPAEATVLVNNGALDEDGCTSVCDGCSVSITATADGYQDYEETLVVNGDSDHSIELEEDVGDTDSDAGDTDTDI